MVRIQACFRVSLTAISRDCLAERVFGVWLLGVGSPGVGMTGPCCVKPNGWWDWNLGPVSCDQGEDQLMIFTSNANGGGGSVHMKADDKSTVPRCWSLWDYPVGGYEVQMWAKPLPDGAAVSDFPRFSYTFPPVLLDSFSTFTEFLLQLSGAVHPEHQHHIHQDGERCAQQGPALANSRAAAEHGEPEGERYLGPQRQWHCVRRRRVQVQRRPGGFGVRAAHAGVRSVRGLCGW